ncbi:MAG: GldG family protein, partial [Endozoicomonas sp.]
RRVTELLEEYVLASRGKLSLEIIDPEPFSEAEDKASEYGLQAVPLGSGNREAYFGLVIVSDEDASRKEVVPFIHPDKERFLEYDISKLVFSVTETEKSKIALISQLQVEGGFDMASRQPTGPWTSVAQLKQLYDVRTLDAQVSEISDDFKLLVLIYPKDLSEQTRYAIDQFVIKGGRALVFVDPVAESDASGMGDMGGMMMATGGSKSATLEPLFRSWGVKMDTGMVLADSGNALTVGSQTGHPVRHLGILGFGEDSFSRDDVVTTSLKSVNFATAGALASLEEGKTRVEVLLHSSKSAMLMDSQKFTFLFDPSSLYREFKPTGDEYALVARISGKV